MIKGLSIAAAILFTIGVVALTIVVQEERKYNNIPNEIPTWDETRTVLLINHAVSGNIYAPFEVKSK